MLAESLNLDQNDDIVTRSFTALGRSCALYFVEGMASGQRMSDSVLRPLLRAQEELSGRQALEAVTRRLIEAPEVKTEKQPYAAVQQLMRGQTLVLIDTVDEAVLVDLRGYIRRPVSIPQTENVVIGPHEAFTEPLRDNLTLLHRMLPTPRLICKLGQVGTRISTQTAVCYLEGICSQETVDEIQRRLEASAIDHVLTVGELSQLIEDDPFAPLPQVVSTERPDRAVSFLLEGQAVILIDGSPRCLAMPVSFWHLFHAPDDSYMRWMYGTFMRVVRAVGAVLALLLPAVFVSMVIFHPLALPMSLLTNIIQSRSIVSISLFGEAVLMLTVFDLINEAGTRIPGLMGSSFGLVSALILGNRRCGRRTGESAVDHHGGAFRPGQLCAAQLLAELCVSHGADGAAHRGRADGAPWRMPSSAADGNARGRHGKPGTPVSCARQSGPSAQPGSDCEGTGVPAAAALLCGQTGQPAARAWAHAPFPG